MITQPFNAHVVHQSLGSYVTQKHVTQKRVTHHFMFNSVWPMILSQKSSCRIWWLWSPWKCIKKVIALPPNVSELNDFMLERASYVEIVKKVWPCTIYKLWVCKVFYQNYGWAVYILLEFLPNVFKKLPLETRKLPLSVNLYEWGKGVLGNMM